MMEDKLERANKRLQDARDDLDKHLEKAHVEEKRLRDRLHHLDKQKRECADANGNLDTSDDDVIEINAGGKIFAVRRGVLCQIKGTKLEALFSGRWDKKLLRDGSGHVFLDVNPKAFRAIIDWLNMLAISSPEERVRMPTVDAECKHLLKHQMELFVEGGVTESANKSDGTSGDKEDGSAKTAGVGANDCVFGRLSEKWVTLKELKADTLSLEKSFNKEEKFIETFFGGKQTSDIVTLNVSGTMMATQRSTLQVIEDSVLARQFDDTKWTGQGCKNIRVTEWSPEDVAKWAKKISKIQEDVSILLKENSINGAELLALNEFGLEKIGVNRAGTICLLLKEIKQLEKVSQDVVTLFEHSPYCFGKILEYLRLKHFSAMGLAEDPTLPSVCEYKKDMFETVVRYYFPSDSSKLILAERDPVPSGFSNHKQSTSGQPAPQITRTPFLPMNPTPLRSPFGQAPPNAPSLYSPGGFSFNLGLT